MKQESLKRYRRATRHYAKITSYWIYGVAYVILMMWLISLQ